jgi:retinol dehydrogenase 12
MLMVTELQSIVFRSPPLYGAYSELYAGFSPEIKAEHNGGYVMAWGRIADLPEDIIQGAKSNAEGGTGAKEKFFEYCNREINGFL